MRAEIANLNHCAVPFLSRADVNLIWYDSIYYVFCILYIFMCTLIFQVRIKRWQHSGGAVPEQDSVDAV